MPAPNRPNTAAGSEAAAALAQQRRYQSAVDMLRAAGYTITPPPDVPDEITVARRAYTEACRRSSTSLGHDNATEIADLVAVRDAAYRVIRLYEIAHRHGSGRKDHP